MPDNMLSASPPQAATDAWRVTGSAFVRASVPRPSPNDDQVQVRVTAVAVGAAEFRGRPAAAVGEVIACGANATHLKGARVAIPGFDPCGECELCRRGDVFLCTAPGDRGVNAPVAMTVCAQARWACRLDGELALDGPEAALVCRDALWAYEGCARLSTGPGDPVVVVGSSALARLVVGVALSRGARPIVLAGDAGAVAVGDRGAEIIEIDDGTSPGRALEAAAARSDLGRRPWRIIDTLGSAQSRRRAVDLAHPGARIALLAPVAAGTTTDAPVPLAAALDAGATITAIRGAHPDLIPEVAALVKRGDLELGAAAALRPGTDLATLTDAELGRCDAAGTTPVFAL